MDTESDEIVAGVLRDGIHRHPDSALFQVNQGDFMFTIMPNESVAGRFLFISGDLEEASKVLSKTYAELAPGTKIASSTADNSLHRFRQKLRNAAGSALTHIAVVFISF